ncbi:MAG: hypothetical protein QW505_04925, partial [Thermoplasmata archaeon]
MVGSAFSVIAPFASAAPDVEFTPPHSDYGDDTNGNGLYEKLIVDATVTVNANGWYRVRGELYDSLDNYITADGYYRIYLMTGIEVVQFSFKWQNIFVHGMDGPFRVEMYVTDNSGGFLDNDTYKTNMYFVSEFEHASFAPPHSDHGEDKNSNGLYDELVVDAVIDSSSNGWFRVQARLYDSLSNEIENLQEDVFLLAGLNSVPFKFSGIYISSNGVDGPFTVQMRLNSDSGFQLDNDLHSTAAYPFSDFEHALFQPPHSDYGEDTNSNGLYDLLIVEAAVAVSSDGLYRVDGNLYDVFSNRIDGASVNVYLLAGSNVVTFAYSGLLVSSNGVDGPFEARLSLYHQSGRLLDTDSHFTHGYMVSDFDYATFAPPHYDYGEDTNSNGLYDNLVVDVSVDTSVEGSYWIFGSLYDFLSNDIGSAYAYVNLPVGTSTVPLRFEGLPIYLNGVDGPYVVNLQISDDLGRFLSSDAHITSPYLCTEFEQPGALFSTPHSDYGIDSDSNGRYDGLAIDVSVTATIEGFYRIQAILFDASSNYISSVGFDTFYLYVGPNICTLEFSWQSIYSHGVDGPYYITLELQDASWVTLDSDDHWTAGYLVSEFEYAVFSPPHSDSGRDTNSNGMYDELIVNASVDVSSENWYRIEATLRDGMGLWIGSASVRVYLASGSSVVVLVFDGVAIRSHGVDGPYNVDLLIRDDSSTLLNSDTHSTAAYLYTDFEYVPPGAVFLPPHSDYGNDTNSNGLYEMLCVAVSVNVVTEGWYHVYSILYDKFFHGIQNYWSDHYLLTGHQTITLAFSGYMISRNGVDGPYHVGMDIYDSTWAWCDSDTYLTASY